MEKGATKVNKAEKIILTALHNIFRDYKSEHIIIYLSQLIIANLIKKDYKLALSYLAELERGLK